MNNLENKIKICKFFNGEKRCRHGDQCKFLHEKNNIYNQNKKRRPKNTENFSPDYSNPDMNIIINIPNSKKYGQNDVIIIPNFIKENMEKEFYHRLLNEINSASLQNEKIWKPWHGDNHLIADDHINWKEKVPSFDYILTEIKNKFNIEIKSSRLNYYKDSSDWKPFHHDAAAIKEHIAEIQNFTVGISLGATRNITFQHAKSGNTVSFSLPNGTAYAFSKNVNINWKHGIPKIHPDKSFEEGRISIIAWAKCEET